MRFLFHDNNGRTNLLRDATMHYVLLISFFLFVFSTDWNQGLLIAFTCSSVLGCFTSSYRRDLCKVNWHIVKYLLHIVYKNILF